MKVLLLSLYFDKNQCNKYFRIQFRKANIVLLLNLLICVIWFAFQRSQIVVLCFLFFLDRRASENNSTYKMHSF